MRCIPLIPFVLACIAVGSCGEPSGVPRSTAPPITTPTTPTPQPPNTTFTLSGVVKEAWIDTGLPGVTVTVVSGPTSGSTTTDPQGRYALRNLAPGIYQLSYTKAAPWTVRGSGPLNVFADATYDSALSIRSTFPATTADLTSYWVAQGPYPNEPSWILIVQNGTRLEGWYKDRQDYSTVMTGTYTGDSVFLNVGVSGLTIEGRVQDVRCIRAVIKNEALGGNFPVTLSRGGNCGR